MEKNYSDLLLKSRNGFSNNYNGCPKYISFDSIEALFAECDLTYESKSVGVLGDILENFAIEILKELAGKVSPSDLKKRVKDIMGS